MKPLHTWLSLVAALFLGGCGRLNSPGILSVEGAEQYTVRLEDFTACLAELDEAGASAQKFLEERGASACWGKLQQLHNSSTPQDLVFDLGQLQPKGVADEVIAAVLRYLARYHPRQVKSLSIDGSSDNHLTALDPAIGQLTNLTTLSLFNNPLTALPTAMAGLKNLTTLYLFNNQLTEIPTAIGQLTNLTGLYLDNNQLTEIPETIGQLENLAGLYLYNNQLTALPTAMAGLTNLIWLNLSYNPLTALPTAIGDLTNLTWLNLANNQLTEIPETIGKLTNLTWLYLDNNQLTEIPETIGKLTNLTWLYLHHNQLTALPTAIGDLTNLTWLSLSNNQLTCFSEKLLLWYQQVGNRIATDENPWWQPAELSMITREKLEKRAETQLDTLHDTIRGMAEAAMRTEKFRVNLVEIEDKVEVTLQNRDFHRLTAFTLLPHLLRQGQWNRDRSIVFFEGKIPFYVAERQLYSQQDVKQLLEDLRDKQLYRFPEAPSGQ